MIVLYNAQINRAWCERYGLYWSMANPVFTTCTDCYWIVPGTITF